MTTTNAAYGDIVRAAEELLSVCDGAHEEDGRGFNKPDSMRVRSLMSKYVLDERDLRDIWERLRKYRVQLSGFGIDYDTLPEPPKQEALPVATARPKVEVRLGPEPHESAKHHKLNFGKYNFATSGKTLYDIASTNDGRSYLEWLARDGRDAAIKQLARDVLDGKELPTPTAVDVEKEREAARPKLFRVGDSTFAVAFPYNPNIVADLKERVSGRRWNGDAKRWEVPAHQVPLVVDLFGGEDKIVMDTAAKAAYYGERARREALDETRAKTDTVDLVEMLLPPFGYQKVGIEFAIRSGGRAGIFDEMGLGKTPQSIGVALYYLNQRPGTKWLKVVPAAVVPNWQREIKKFAGEECCVWTSKGPKGDLDARFHVTNYETLVLRPKIKFLSKQKNQCQHLVGEVQCRFQVLPKGKPVVPMYCKEHEKVHKRRTVEDFSKSVLYQILAQNFIGVSCDEAHYMQTRNSLRTQAVMGAARKADLDLYPGILPEHRLLLSGTPVLNRPADLYALVSYLDPTRFGSWYQYANRYGAWQNDGAWVGESRPTKPRNLDELHEKVKDLCIRRLQKEVQPDLPPLRESDLHIALDEKQMREYRKLLQEMMGEWKKTRRPGVVEMNRLKEWINAQKIPHLWEMLDEMLEAGRTVLVFATRREPLQSTLERYRDLAVYIDGTVKPTERQRRVDLIQSGEKRLGCCTIKAAGVGLNITKADTVIFLDIAWTPADHDQAKKRAHRYGVEHPVHVQYMLAEDTTDEIMRDVLAEKLAVADTILDGAPVTKKRPRSMFRDFVTKLKRKYNREMKDIDTDNVGDYEGEEAA